MRATDPHTSPTLLAATCSGSPEGPGAAHLPLKISYSGSRTDVTGRLWDVHAPLAGEKQKKKVAAYLSTAPNAKRVLDAVYSNKDDEYRDARALDEIRP